jgi:hypothetical protein
MPISQSMLGVAAEKASPLEGASSQLKTGSTPVGLVNTGCSPSQVARPSIGTIPLFVLNWMSGPGLGDAVGVCLQIS